jgi:kumamolisin
MTNPTHVPLPGSTRATSSGTTLQGPIDPTATVEFTVILRRKAELPEELVYGPETITAAELADKYGADPADLALVTSTLAAAGALILEQHVGSRRVRASAPASAARQLFATELHLATSGHPISGAPVQHRARTGDLSVPAELDGVVEAVLGLDNRPQSRTYVLTAQDPTVAYTPPELGLVYGFPTNADGAGQTAAIVELGGGITAADLNTYFSGLGLKTPSVVPVSVDGATNSPDPNYDGEVMLDIEVFGALAPKANQVVYFGPNSDQGFIDCISQAVHATPTPAVISISWGADEEAWDAQSRTAMDKAFADGCALGVTTCVASGDKGSTNGDTDGQQHTQYPASSPYVLAVGGTTLHADRKTGAVSSEVVWHNSNGNATGGGVSTLYPVPVWQAGVGVPTRSGATSTGRGVPDVAADADPYTGYTVRVDGADVTYGGTSAAAPLWAALLTRYTQLLNLKLGLVQTLLYKGAKAGQEAPGFRAITSGGNGAYNAGAGWNACTGLGTPEGAALLAVLHSDATAKHPAHNHPPKHPAHKR